MKLKFLILSGFMAINSVYGMEDQELRDQRVIVSGKDILVLPQDSDNNNNKGHANDELAEDFDINNCVNFPNGNSPLLHAATYQNDPEVIGILVKYGADVKQKNKITGWTALHHACHYNSPQVIEALVLQGAPVTAKNNDGLTPLMMAIVPNVGSGASAAANTEALLKAIQKSKELAALKKALKDHLFSFLAFLLSVRYSCQSCSSLFFLFPSCSFLENSESYFEQ